jgi:hypothetical protein
MSFIEAFFGSTQSQFTAYAIFGAVISICISIILSGTDMTIGNRFLLIFFVLLAVLPSILLMLLQITCMVTGGNKNDRWWCWLYSWIIAIFVIIYCIFVIIISLSSLFTYNNAISKVDMSEQNNKMSPENSNNYAKMMIDTNSKQEIEKFMNLTSEEEDVGNSSSVDIVQKFTNKDLDDSTEMTMTQNFTNGGSPPDMAMMQKFTNGGSPPNMDLIQKFTNGGSPPDMAMMQKFTNGSNVENTIQQFTDAKITSSVSPTTLASPSNPTLDSKIPPQEKKDGFTSREMLDDEPEPFTNRNYASFR